MNHTAHDVSQHTQIYLYIFGALAVLTVVTVAIGYLSLPIGTAVVVALLIASVKGSLVASVFMHLRSEKKIIYWLLLMTFFFLLALFILIIASIYDFGGTPNVA